jgi:hypothetical protein
MAGSASFADGLTATASVAVRDGLRKSVKEFVDQFKERCTDRAKAGFFSADVTFWYVVTDNEPARPARPMNRFVSPGEKRTEMPVCVVVQHQEFEKMLKSDIEALGFKETSCTVVSPAVGIVNSIKITASWKTNREAGDGVRVKRDNEGEGGSGAKRARS